MALGPSPMDAFQIGQSLGGGSALGAFAKGLTDRLERMQSLRDQSQAEIQTAVGIEQAVAPFKTQNQLTLEREKSKLQQQTQQQSYAQMQELMGAGTPAASGAEGAASRFRQGKKTMSFTTDADGNLKPTVSIQEIEGMPGETGGRAALMIEGQRQVKEARGLLFPDGTIKSYRRDFAQRAAAPWELGQIGSTEYQNFQTLVKNAIEGKLRAETGAAAPEDEVRRIMKRFMPGIFATPEAALKKMDELESYLNTAIGLLDPSGRFLGGQQDTAPEPVPPRAEERIRVRKIRTGEMGTVSSSKFNPAVHERL